jgi:hypothetical protein
MKKCDFRKNARLLACTAALAAVLATRPANGQAEDQAAARSLFEEARRLLKAGQFADACRKLEAASNLYSSVGVLLNLADCYEKVGRSASAWTEFGEAASVAGRGQRPEQVKEAKRRQSALEPKLTLLSVRVSSNVPGLQIKRDETKLASGMWGTAVPVDPGAHEIRAEAPGREPWTTTVTVSTPGETKTVDVPELRPLPAVAAAPPSRREPEPPSSFAAMPSDATPAASRSHVLDGSLIGAGAAVAIAGGVLMAIEAVRASDANRENTSAMTSPQAIADYNSTRVPYYIGLGAVIAGGVSATAGLLMLAMWHDSSRATGVRVLPRLGLGAGGVGLHQAW